jgi:hypothetical protein
MSGRVDKSTGLSSPTEPCSTVSALTGFDPSRMDAAWLVGLICDYGGGYVADRDFCPSKLFHERYPEFVALRKSLRARGDTPSEATISVILKFAEAIAIEAHRTETTKIGSVHEGANPKGIAHA